MAIVAVFAFVFAFEYLFHGILLQGLYEQTASVWRPKEEHSMVFLFLSEILFSAVAVYFFTRNYEAKGIGEGVRFGLLVGLLLGSVEIATYCYLPIPFALTGAWVIAAILKGLGAGVVSSLVYKQN